MNHLSETRFAHDGVERFTPITFAIAFVAKMRAHAGLSHTPSLRTTLAIPRLLSARYFRQHSLNPSDYLDAAVLNTPYEDQSTARILAKQLLFPEPVLPAKPDGIGPANAEAADPLAMLLQDISSLNLDLDQIESLEAAINSTPEGNELFRAYEVYDSLFASQDPQDRALGQLISMWGGPGELASRGVKNRADLSTVVAQILHSQVGALSPEMIQLACAAGFGDRLLRDCTQPWELAAVLCAMDRSTDLQELTNEAAPQLEVRALGKMLRCLRAIS